MQPNPMRRVERAGSNRRWERWGIMLVGAFVLMVTASGGASPAPGALTQLADPDGCIMETGDNVTCINGKALDQSVSVAVSPDGKHVYVASSLTDAVAVFSREK